jgi:hypothetical protein
MTSLLFFEISEQILFAKLKIQIYQRFKKLTQKAGTIIDFRN